jgi:type II secretory pathway component PulK
MMRARSRPGVALATVLWTIAMAGVVAASIQLSTRDLSDAVENRVVLNRLRWQAYGCGEEVMAALVSVLSGPSYDPVWRSKWLGLGGDLPLIVSDGEESCELTARPGGSRLSVRALAEPGARRLAAALGTSIDPQGLSAALRDWEDADDLPTRAGGEQDWYLSRLRAVPRNDSVQSYEELRLVGEFSDWPRMESTLTLDDAPVAINVAPREVLAALPGFTLATASEVMVLRARGRFPSTHQDLLNLLSAPAAENILKNFAALTERSTLDPWEWEIEIVARDERRGLRVRESFTVLPSDRGVSVREYRQW